MERDRTEKGGRTERDVVIPESKKGKRGMERAEVAGVRSTGRTPSKRQKRGREGGIRFNFLRNSLVFEIQPPKGCA